METPQFYAGRVQFRVGRLRVRGSRVDRALRHGAPHHGRSIRKRLLLRGIKGELARQRALSAEAALSRQGSSA